MTNSEFCNALKMLGTDAQAASAMGLNLRTLQRIKSGAYGVSAHNERALAQALLAHAQACTTAAQRILSNAAILT